MSPVSRRRLAFALPALLLAGCDLLTDAPTRVASVEFIDAGPLVQRLRITLAEPGPVEVEYGTDGGPILRVVSPRAGTHDVELTRLRAASTYSYRVAGGPEGVFVTGALPDDLAAVRFAADGDLGVALVLVHLFDPDGFKGYAIVDGGGNVVWYRRTGDLPFGIVRRESGTYVLMDRDAGLLEITPAGEVLASVAQDTAHRELHHDVIATPDNTLLFIAHDPRTVDGRKVRGDAIWEWWPGTGTLEKRWTSWNHLSLDDDRGPRFGSEWLHANALALGEAGNVLLSLHYLNQVISLSPDMTTVQWRLGGVNATIALDSTDTFTGQHTPTEVGPGRVLLFDNALEAGGPSRALELELDGDSAVRRFAWSSPAGNFASAVSSARRLATGNTLVAFGMREGVFGASGPTEAFEVRPDGSVAWHLTVTGPRVMFRAEPWEAVGAEVVVR